MATTKKVPTEVKKESPENTIETTSLVDDLAEDLVTPTKPDKTKPAKKRKAVSTKLISATSKVSTELDGVWYSFSFSESRMVEDDSDIETARQDLWNVVHTEVDNQVQYTIDSIRGTTEATVQPNPSNINTYDIPPAYNY